MASSLMALSTSNVLTVINSLLLLLGGVAAFIVGMNVMGSNLEKAAGKPMRRLMGKATKNRFRGVLTGTAVTAIVTSSSATTVMIIGFVNVGLMTLMQAVPVIMGANIGTTITAFISAISTAGADLSITSIFAFLAFIGVLMAMISKKDRIKRIGSIFQGVGLIFIGMNVMSSSVSGLMTEYIVKDGVAVLNPIAEAVKKMFVAIGLGKEVLSWEIPVLFILGAVLTGLMQSSAAITAIVISLSTSGLISLPMAMFIILGTNVGTCVTALLSSMGTSVNARRTAVVHLLFNLIGGVIFMIPLSVPAVSGGIAKFLQSFIKDISWQIAIFHMVFNLLTTALLVGFVKYLVKFACLLVPDKKGEAAGYVETLDKRFLKTPAIAVGQVRKQLLKLGGEAFANYKLSLDMLLTGDTSSRKQFDETETEINAMHKYIISYLVQLSLQEISEVDEKKISSFYHVSSDLERIGDYAENICEFAQKAAEDKVDFTEKAREEIREMDLHITNLYKYTCEVFEHSDLSFIPDVEMEEAETDRMNELMQQMHLQRMNDGECTAEAGSLFLQLAVSMERIGDHMHNIAESVKAYGHNAQPQPQKRTAQ
ncbi:MAG: Na/Pi cotransporter family protein [Clostridia bacterium]|nr:Na/Pi cotransporter family protein [Clostridia bacterium]